MLRITVAFLVFLCHYTTFSQVNPQNGSAVQSFPLVSYSDGKSGLSLQVAATYSSGNGLVVSDLASDLGTGWNLQAGGVIVRLQSGQPDDQIRKDVPELTGNNSLKRFPDGYMYNQHVNKGCHISTNSFVVFPNENTVFKQKNDVASDLEQDRFAFSMNGHSGMFIIGRNGQATTIGDSRLKISYSTANMQSQLIRTTITSFTITTEDGLHYTFSEKGLTKTLRYKLATRNAAGQWVVESGSPSNASYKINRFYGFDELTDGECPWVVSSWYLSSIENTNNGSKIFFDYTETQTDIIANKHVSQARNLNKSGPRWDKENGDYWIKALSRPETAHEFSFNANSLGKLKPGPTSLTYFRSLTKDKRLSKVRFPDQSEVQVDYANTDRADLPNNKLISKVIYYVNSKMVRGYEFKHGYALKNSMYPSDWPFSQFDKKLIRPYLLSIQKFGDGNDDAYEPPYVFSYHMGSMARVDDIVPPRNSLSIDHWGYYNGWISGLSATEDHDFLRDEDRQYGKLLIGMLHNPNEGYPKNGLLKSVRFPTGSLTTYDYIHNKNATWNHPYMEPLFVGGVSVSKVTTTGQEGTISTEYAYIKANGSSSRWGDEKPHYTGLSISHYNQTWRQKVDKYVGIEYPEAAMASPQVNILKNALISTVAGIALQTGISWILGATAASIFSGVMLAVGIIQFVIGQAKTYDFDRFTVSNQNNTNANLLGAYYSRVEVKTNSPTGYDGKTVIEYTDQSDYPILVPKNEWPWIQNQRTASWVYGLPKKILVYDKDNNIVSEKTNAYAYRVEKIADANNVNCKCATIETESSGWNYWSRQTGFSWNKFPKLYVVPRRYYHYTGRTDLVSSTEKTFTAGALVYTNSVRIHTDPEVLLQTSRSTPRDNRSVLVEHTYYPKDYTVGDALQTLKSRNAIHTPVATETWLTTLHPTTLAPQSTTLVDASATEYTQQVVNGLTQVKPWKTYKLKTAAPLPVSTVGTHNPAMLLRHPQYFKQTAEFVYDAAGNLVETMSLDQSISYINDYKDKYVSATVLNASAGDIAYTGFESDGKGSWTYAPHFVQATGHVTGSQAYALSGTTLSPQGQASTITRSISSSKTYQLTYWVNGSGNHTVNGQPGEILFDRGDGWKLIGYTINGSSTINIEGNNVLIDDLRLHPKGSLMSTVTYKEGVGKVAEADANNRIVYYEYDGLGRLLLTRDQSRNIIKTYEYNFAK